MRLVTARHLQRAFGLPRALAAEVVADGTRHALRHRWQPWAWLLLSLGWPALALGLGGLRWQALRHLGGLSVLLAALAGWVLLARWMAGEAMLAAAAAKARRIGCTPRSTAATQADLRPQP